MARLLSRKETNKRKTLFRDEAMEAAAALPSDDITFEQAWIIHKLDCLGCLLHDVHNPKSTNCRDNPYCIKRLGLEKFEKLIKAEKINTAKVEESQKRRDILEVPCGLTNSGNFCYVNSFLQVWYNDPVFRQIIFDWRPSPDYVRPAPPAMDVEAVMNSLQHLFYTMQTTPFEDTDDNRHFTGALRLGNEQQDAQEFSLVLFDALDRNLPKHPHGEEIRQRIRERYSGSTSQRIWCTCGKESSRSSPFTALQLNIDGFKTLHEVLDAYFGEELLEDYLCDECERRGYVKRQTLPEKLPPVVMLQLNRYVFDVNGRNRKLKTPIIYPRELSARSFHFNVSKYDDFDYELFAVMIHEGDNTYCGHYYDLVRHPFTGVWYKYNDEHVEQLARPPGVDRSKTIPGGRPTPDMKACYGLAYRRKEPSIPEIIMPPDDITETWIVATEHKFDGQTKETIAKSERRLNDLTLRYSQLSSLFDALETNADRYKTPKDVAFLPTKLLSEIIEKEYVSMAETDEKNETAESSTGEKCMLEEPTAIVSSKRPIRASRLRTVRHKIAGQLSPQEMPVCHHGRLFVDSVLFGDVKAVSRVTAESLLSQYGITTKIKYDSDASESVHPLLTGCDICVDCVKELRREGQFRDSLESHVKLANRIFKDKTRCSLSRVPKPEGYLYISKKCLSNFKKLALREMEHQHKLQSAGATLQFIVDLATVDSKYSASASSPRRSRGARRKRLMPKSKDGSPSCNGCHTPSKHAKDDVGAVATNCDEATSSALEVKEENDDGENGLGAADGTSCEADTEKSPVVEEMTPSPYEMEEKPPSLDDGVREMAEIDAKSSSVSSLESGSQSMEEERPMPVENGTPRSEEGEVEKAAQEKCEAQGTDTSPPERPSSSPLERPSSSASRSSTHESGAVEFNSELRCEHGGINLDEFRQAVSPDEWKQLSSYFDPATTFLVRCDEPICQQCEHEFNAQQWGKQELKESLRDLRGRIGELLREIDRRRPTEEEYGTIYSRGICSRFLSKLNAIIRARTSSLLLPSICQDCVLCSHGLPNVGLACDIGNVHLVALTEQEWTKLCEEIATGLGTIHSEPPRPIIIQEQGRIENMCEGCFGERLEALNIQRYVYNDAFIYVALSEDGALSATLPKTTRRTQKNKCFKVKMSSTDTIKDLKIQLYKQTGQTPNDQLLYRELGGSLLDGDSTLFEARIEKNNADQPLILIAQSMSAVSTKYDEQQARVPERGFIDTALAH
ncbi:USP domain-containing protein [Trichostrongylus colubriformis]|uniref:ubiquitinyl hydrolase 1 n=1 Tax=Trichostrongylus colubriformis TaxID=6319 RepID=A0AAN8IU37_TRICO